MTKGMSSKRICNQIAAETYDCPPKVSLEKKCEVTDQMIEIREGIMDKIDYYYRQREVRRQAKGNVRKPIKQLMKRCREYTFLGKQKQLKRWNQESNVKLHARLHKFEFGMNKFDESFEEEREFEFAKPVCSELSEEKAEEITRGVFSMKAYAGA